jgi:hypothetical protein
MGRSRQLRRSLCSVLQAPGRLSAPTPRRRRARLGSLRGAFEVSLPEGTFPPTRPPLPGEPALAALGIGAMLPPAFTSAGFMFPDVAVYEAPWRHFHLSSLSNGTAGPHHRPRDHERRECRGQ